MPKTAAKKTETKKDKTEKPTSKKVAVKKDVERSVDDASEHYMNLIDQDHYAQSEASQEESVEFYRNIASTCNERADLIESEMEEEGEEDSDDEDEDGDSDDEE